MDVRRVVEVWNPVGKCAGTGYLVADGLVLTALHNVLGCGTLEVRRLGDEGAALFARGRLVGVVTTDRQRDYEADQLTAVSVASLAARPGFTVEVKAAGVELIPEEVTAADEERARTAYDVEVRRGVNNLPELPSPIFVGRAEAMAALERALAADSQTITQTVHGLGGVGKTTLALHYAHDHVGSYRLVWWIRADTPELIEAGFAALTLRLRGGETEGDLTTAQAAEWAVGWLQTHPGWLLVFDNAERAEDVYAWTGQLRAAGRHLITSRYKRGWVCDPIPLAVLDEDASLALLSRLGGADDEDEARALADDLGHLPLALEQAGAFIGQTGITIAEYRDMLRSHPDRTTDAAPGGSDPARTVARIWRITLDALQERDPRAVEILRIAAWYAPTGIPRTVLAPLAEDALDLAQLLGMLADYNMITLDRAGVGIHRLVQMVSRTPSTGDPHRDQARVMVARTRAVELLYGRLPADPRVNIEGWPSWRDLLPHVEAILGAYEWDEDTAETAETFRMAGLFLESQGQLSQAIEYYGRTLAAVARLFGEDHPSTLFARNNLASVYESTKDLDRAVPLYERTLEDAVRVWGESDPQTLMAQNNLAVACWSSGQVERALALFERTLADQLRILGDDHPDTLNSRNNLAEVYRESGRVERALALFERTLADRERLLGEDHLDTLVSRNNLASAYWQSGQVERALALFERTLADRERLLGEDHPDTLISRNNLAYGYWAVGDLRRAILLYEHALAGCARVLGEDHPTTKVVRVNLSAARAQEP